MSSLIGRLARTVNETPIPYVPKRTITGLPGASSGRGAEMRAMQTMGTVFSIVHLTSTAVSQVNWRLYRITSDQRRRYEGEINRTEVTRHPALAAFNRPNAFYTQGELLESTQQHLDLTGEGVWVIGRDPRMTAPLELWPVRPDRIEPVPDPQDFISGYIYHGPDGQKIPLETNEVIRMRMPNPLDPYRGLGPIQSMLTDIDSAVYSAEWNRNFFLNSAEPGGIIQVDKRLSDDEFDEMRDRWNEQHKGVAAAHRVAILEQGQWVDRKFSQRDMQFTELRALPRELVREAFGVPKPMLGTVDDANRANMEAAETMFARWVTTPRLDRIKQALNTQYLPMFGAQSAGLEFDYEDPVPEDAESRDRERDSKSRAWSTLVEAGADPDDVSDMLGMPRLNMTREPAGG